MALLIRTYPVITVGRPGPSYVLGRFGVKFPP
jgi:hypothetical protein